MITVMIATYNGERTLETVLNAYCKLEMQKARWKLVLIDNGSDDNTKAVVLKFKNLLPLKYLFEPRRGKNAALNTGLSEIEGDLVVFADDDIIPQPDWLNQLEMAADTQPSYSMFGGAILPEWESLPEEWLLSWVPLRLTYGILDDLSGNGPIEYNLVFGGNMALRSQIFDMGYRFNESIGPNGTSYAQGSEAQLCKRLHKDGFRAWHCKRAIVRHMIEATHMTKRWTLERAIRFGRGQYRLGREYQNCKALFGGIPIRLFWHITKRIYFIGKAYLSKSEEDIYRAYWKFNYVFGVGLEARAMHKERLRFRNLSN
jgi:glycosyltransferase involved in cell wall biosynthesis